MNVAIILEIFFSWKKHPGRCFQDPTFAHADQLVPCNVIAFAKLCRLRDKVICGEGYFNYLVVPSSSNFNLVILSGPFDDLFRMDNSPHDIERNDHITENDNEYTDDPQHTLNKGEPSVRADAAIAEIVNTKRGLKQRHIQMIALASQQASL
jgi:hypothetical protein